MKKMKKKTNVNEKTSNILQKTSSSEQPVPNSSKDERELKKMENENGFLIEYIEYCTKITHVQWR